MVIAGHTQTIHPDFTIINIHTGKITYWEHAGRMDDAQYADDLSERWIHILRMAYFRAMMLL